MKAFLILSVLTFVGLSLARKPYPGGCIYVDGICQSECPVGTYSYNTGCDYLTPEPTCTVPDPEPDKTVQICDYSACYCEPPTVRNEKCGKCVPLDECPK